MSEERDIVLSKLESKINDESASPEKRNAARIFRDKIISVCEKRAVMQECPALCLMELRRAVAAGERALELALRYTGRRFWHNAAFCREAVKITPEAKERVNVDTTAPD